MDYMSATIPIRLTPSTRPSFVRNPKQKDEKRCRRTAVRTVRPACRLPPRRRLRRRPLGRKPKKPVRASWPRAPCRRAPTRPVQPQPEQTTCRNRKKRRDRRCPRCLACCCHHRRGWRSQNLTVAAPRQTPSRPIPPPRKPCCRPSCGAVPTPHSPMQSCA